jgi:hypothetical protein
MRVFYAHPSSEDSATTKTRVEFLRGLLQMKINGTFGEDNAPKVIVVPGRRDHAKNWRGDWEHWQHQVVHRSNAITGKPVYSIFVCPEGRCGRATANILGMALTKGRPVFSCGLGVLNKIDRIHVIDSEDWVSGYIPLAAEQSHDT